MSEDRRVRRTRTALMQAFNRLVLSRKRDIKVTDIVAEADVGRSTFYDHYASADDLHQQALAQPLAILADALAADGTPDQLAGLLDHFWDNRQRARDTLCGDGRDKVARLLAELVEQRLEAGGGALSFPQPLAAMQLAEAGLAPIRGWLMAQASISSAELAEAISRSAAALRAALRE